MTGVRLRSGRVRPGVRVAEEGLLTCLAPISRTVIQVVHREPSIPRQTKVIHGERAQRLDCFLILWRGLPRVRRNLVDAVRDEEDEVNQESIGRS